VARLEALNGAQRQALRISRVAAGSPAADLLSEGDLLLAIDGTPVNRPRDVERLSRSPQVTVTLLRNGRESNVEVATAPLGGRDIDRLMLWAGAVLHEPHRAMAWQRGIPPEGVFVAYFSYGSPATRYGLFAGRRILEVDGRPVADLDAFIESVRGRADRSSVRLKTVTWNGSTDVITLKLDRHYWPASEVVRTADGWERRALE
jgi:S1-C subfamily serine protease